MKKITTQGAMRSLAKTARYLLLLSTVFSLNVPVDAQSGRALRLTRIFERAAGSAESRVSTATRLSRVSTRGSTRAIDRLAKPELSRTRSPEGRSLLGDLRNSRPGSISVSRGSVTRKRPESTVAFATKQPTITANAGASALRETQGRNLGRAAELQGISKRNLTPRARRELGRSIHDAEQSAAAAKTNAIKAEAREIAQRKAFPHKNSNRFNGPTHVYVIVGPDRRIHKIGESAAGLRKRDSRSIRAESQVRKLNRENGNITGDYRSRILKTFTNKREARAFERQIIEAYRRKHGPRALRGERVLGGNRSNR